MPPNDISSIKDIAQHTSSVLCKILKTQICIWLYTSINSVEFSTIVLFEEIL